MTPTDPLTEREKTALEHLQKALRAPARACRELADAGRRQEITALIAKIRGEQVARSE